MKRPQESQSQLLPSYSEIMHHLPKHEPDERDDLERDKVLHAQLIESRREKQRKVILERLRKSQSDRIRNLLK